VVIREPAPRLYRGFTLVEIVVVFAIVAVLSALLYFATDPGRKLAEVRDNERRSASNAMLAAVLRYALDSNGRLPAELESAKADQAYIIGTARSGCQAGCGALETAPSCVDLSPSLVGTYLGAMPKDPNGGTSEKTGYYIKKSADRRLTVGACFPERAEGISVIR